MKATAPRHLPSWGAIVATLFVSHAMASAARVPEATDPPARMSKNGAKFLSADLPLGDIMRSPAGLKVLKKHKPELLANDEVNLLLTLPLRGIWGWFPGYTSAELGEIDAELRLIPAPPPDPTGPMADPVFRPQRLALANVPKSAATPKALFNGRDLSGWDTWLGPDGTTGGEALGLNNDPKRIFSVQMVDGAPAIRSDGAIWGTLITKGDYRNYRLHLEYRWGATPKGARNNGVLYHSYGPYGALNKQWMRSIELEMIPGVIAGVNQVGGQTHFLTTVGRNTSLTSTTKRQFMLRGRKVEIGFKGFEFIEGATNAERPIGEWNSIDLYVVGGSAVHVLNGVPILRISGATMGKQRTPLTHGRIQLQSEGAETFFRNITIEPIDRLPTIVAR